MKRTSGQLRIGDTWNAISIIASSQTNPLKAIAEFVENSIDAHASNVTIVRGKAAGASYLRISDDGEGIPKDADGIPDFRRVATHICDSVKRQLKAQGATGIQGEFGIGLLSFWTVGDRLVLTSSGTDGHAYDMTLVRNEPGYEVRRRRMLFPPQGVELAVSPLLRGLRQLSGEKIQWYLASELRDRIRSSGVNIRVVDRQARKEFRVEPRRYTGRLLHQIPAARTDQGEIYLELYLAEPGPENRVALFRQGTRVLENLASLERFGCEPWTSGYLEGIVDAPFLKITPGTRTGILHDETYEEVCRAMEAAEEHLRKVVEEQRQAEEQRASRDILRSIQKALREALLDLPPEEYDWFDVRTASRSAPAQQASEGETLSPVVEGESSKNPPGPGQKKFFEYAGPLHSVRISPASAVVRVNTEKSFRAIPRDKGGRRVEQDLSYRWRISEGAGTLSAPDAECVVFRAPAEPGLTSLELLAAQGKVECKAEAVVTVTETLTEDLKDDASQTRKGLPGYTFHRAPGELWRSRYDAERNLIVINNGHRDFVYASRTRARKVRYVAKLFAKELVCKNFPGMQAAELLERMVELSLRMEENL